MTQQSLSYVIDVYRGKTEPQKNILKLFLYISFFPQLIAGPIIKYHDVSAQINARRVSSEKICSGIYRFMCGLGKKILIANIFAYPADVVYGISSGELGTLAAWIGAVSYMFQIYFDFSGYSDMAIGLGKMFGFDFAENFDHPYISDSIREFWHRWHISLSSWFKEYMYIPLGGNRKGKARTIINRYLVFLATGIWHGANFTFLAWGAFHGTLLVLEGEKIIPVEKDKTGVFRRIYTLAQGGEQIIYDIYVTSSSYPTAKGISVGSDKDEVRAAYGEPDRTMPASDTYQVPDSDAKLIFTYSDGSVSGIDIC